MSRGWTMDETGALHSAGELTDDEVRTSARALQEAAAKLGPVPRALGPNHCRACGCRQEPRDLWPLKPGVPVCRTCLLLSERLDADMAETAERMAHGYQCETNCPGWHVVEREELVGYEYEHAGWRIAACELCDLYDDDAAAVAAARKFFDEGGK